MQADHSRIEAWPFEAATEAVAIRQIGFLRIEAHDPVPQEYRPGGGQRIAVTGWPDSAC